VTINLNREFEGGDLRFPEFGPRLYRAPLGGAIVFSCSLLHQVTQVTAGTRYATLPFLHDEAADRVLASNEHFLAGETSNRPVGSPA
jgi:predicted 2-oxoglutarate/Fe(II)-dependent dioxygenase YbiX